MFFSDFKMFQLLFESNESRILVNKFENKFLCCTLVNLVDFSDNKI